VDYAMSLANYLVRGVRGQHHFSQLCSLAIRIRML